MNELKTLKDIEKETAKETGMEKEDVLVDGNILRKEIIRHIKAIDYETESGFEIKDYLMWFFNITEEDFAKNTSNEGVKE